jgi:hypothetical protein
VYFGISTTVDTSPTCAASIIMLCVLHRASLLASSSPSSISIQQKTTPNNYLYA